MPSPSRWGTGKPEKLAAEMEQSLVSAGLFLPNQGAKLWGILVSKPLFDLGETFPPYDEVTSCSWFAYGEQSQVTEWMVMLAVT